MIIFSAPRSILITIATLFASVSGHAVSTKDCDMRKSSSVECVGRALASGDDINAYDSFGATLLMNAVATKNLVMVKFLLDAGARTDIRSKHPKFLEWTALDYSAMVGDASIARALLESGANPSGVPQSSPLAKAIWYDREDIADLIIHYNPNSETDPKYKYTGLTAYFASSATKQRKLEYLAVKMIQAGWSRPISDVNGGTPLCHALIQGRYGLATALVTRGLWTSDTCSLKLDDDFSASTVPPLCVALRDRYSTLSNDTLLAMVKQNPKAATAKCGRKPIMWYAYEHLDRRVSTGTALIRAIAAQGANVDVKQDGISWLSTILNSASPVAGKVGLELFALGARFNSTEDEKFGLARSVEFTKSYNAARGDPTRLSTVDKPLFEDEAQRRAIFLFKEIGYLHIAEVKAHLRLNPEDANAKNSKGEKALDHALQAYRPGRGNTAVLTEEGVRAPLSNARRGRYQGSNELEISEILWVELVLELIKSGAKASPTVDPSLFGLALMRYEVTDRTRFGNQVSVLDMLDSELGMFVRDVVARGAREVFSDGMEFALYESAPRSPLKPLYAKFASFGLTVRSESLQGFFAVLPKPQYQRAIAQLEAANATIDAALATQLFKNLIIQGYYVNSSLSYLTKMGADINDPLDDGSSMVVLVADKGQPDDLSNFLKMGPRLPDFASLAIQAAKASNFKKVDYWVGIANKLGKPLSNTQANAVAAATVDVLDASQYQNMIAKLEAASVNVEPLLATRIFRRLLAQGRYSDSLIPYLIKAGADINVTLDDGSSMLLLIAEKGTTSELTNFLKMKPQLPEFNVEALQAAKEHNFTRVEYWVGMASKLGKPLSKAQSLAISATVAKERQLIAEEERRASAKIAAQPRYERVRNSLESVTFLYFDMNKTGLGGPMNVHAVRCTNGQSTVITEMLNARSSPGLNAFFVGGQSFVSLNEAANRYCN